jgi:hypothetical protein
MKRRQMTQFLALLAGGVAVSSFAAVPALGGTLRRAMSPAYLTREFFETQLGREFSLEGERARKLKLKSVESACCHHSREQFHAVFEASPGEPLEEGIYVLERDNRPRMGLFMTVSDAGTSAQRLVATINLQTVA